MNIQDIISAIEKYKTLHDNNVMNKAIYNIDASQEWVEILFDDQNEPDVRFDRNGEIIPYKGW